MINGKVLDTSAVLDIATGATVYGQALLAVANQLGQTLAIPTATYSAAWQAPVDTDGRLWLDLLTDPDAEPVVVIVPLDIAGARGAGLLAADAGQHHAPMGTVHATYVARQRSWPVVTNTPDVVLAVAPDVRTETIP